MLLRLGLNLKSSCLRLLECWGYKCMSLHLAHSFFIKISFVKTVRIPEVTWDHSIKSTGHHRQLQPSLAMWSSTIDFIWSFQDTTCKSNLFNETGHELDSKPFPLILVSAYPGPASFFTSCHPWFIIMSTFRFPSGCSFSWAITNSPHHVQN